MLHFGSLDERVNATWPGYEKTLKANDADYVAHFYDGANHGFHNDSTGRYVPADAELSWSRTIEFFKKNLAGAWEEAMTRLSDGLSNASTILNDKGTDSKRRAPVHDSLLENLRTQAGIVRAMGQTLDKPEMVKLATRVEQELLRFSAATLRANPDVRDRIGKKCAEVSNKAKLEAHTTAKRMDEMMDEMEDFI